MGRETNRKLKVALLDGQPLVREAVKTSLERDRGLTVLGTGANLTEACVSFGARNPDVWVVDPASTDEELRDIRDAYPSAKLVVFSSSESPALARNALRDSADGCLLKTTSTEGELVHAIRTVHTGGVYFSADASRMLIRGPNGAPGNGNGLTPREREVLRMIAEGHTSRGIALELRVSIRTVDSHRKHISQKLGIRSIARLTRYAISNGIVET